MKEQNPNRMIAALLAMFPLTGGMGIHLLYTRAYGAGVAWCVTSTLLSWTVIVPVIFMVVSFVQGIMYLCYSEREWARRFEE